MINDTQMDSGEKLRWECKAMGRPRPTYRWLRNGLPLMSQVPIKPWNTLLLTSMKHQNSYIEFTWMGSILERRGLHITMENLEIIFLHMSFFWQSGIEILNGELTIHKVQQTDSGMYQCVAENKYAAIYSSAELKILGSRVFPVKSVILKIDGTAKENKPFFLQQRVPWNLPQKGASLHSE